MLSFRREAERKWKGNIEETWKEMERKLKEHGEEWKESKNGEGMNKKEKEGKRKEVKRKRKRYGKDTWRY